MAQLVTNYSTFDTNTNTNTNNNDQKKRSSKGKQPIEIKLIENKQARQVCYAKRRPGLFKKIGDLCSKYDAQAAVITFSEAGKLYSFGCPNVDVVIHRYINSLNNNNSNNYNDHNLVEYSDNNSFWWDRSIDNLGLEELERFKGALEGLRNEVITTINEINDCSMIKVYGNYDYDGNYGRLGTQVSDFGCKKKETQEVIRPELLSPDNYLNLISTKGFA